MENEASKVSQTPSTPAPPAGEDSVHCLVRIIFLVMAWGGLTLMATGFVWVYQYAVGEWTGDMGRWDYWRANFWLSVKGPAATLLGFAIAGLGCLGWVIYPNVPDHRSLEEGEP
jgi:hypothetical protein